MLRIALDENIPQWLEIKIKQRHKVVFRAPRGSQDRDWVDAALFHKANVFVSRDLDIPNLIQDLPQTFWLEYPDAHRKVVARVVKQRLKIIHDYLNAAWRLRFLSGKSSDLYKSTAYPLW